MAKVNAISKIGKRASQLYNKAGNTKSYQQCNKMASAEYRAGKLGGKQKSAKKKAAKPKYRQTGTSNKKRDAERQARPPGARKPRGGKKVTYYERRKNRSDMPGKLTGAGQNEVVIRHLREQNTALADATSTLMQLQARRKEAVRIKAKFSANELKYRIADQKKLIKAIKHNIRMLRILVK